MEIKIKITPPAETDIQRAVDFYNKVQKGLGNEFRNELKVKVNHLRIVPASGSFLYENVRFRVMKRFPFIILYILKDNNQIDVLRIFNTS
ncbi:MAG: type II toxin-antitoxin system RelE/ParE family toxin [Ferruginibacter sp.]